MKTTSRPGRSSIVAARRIDQAARAATGLVVLLLVSQVCRAVPVFEQTDLVSSVLGRAPATDSNLRNPWGIAYSATSPFWVGNQATGTSTLYNGAGQPFPVGSPLVVTIPSAGTGSGSPTGVVFNPTTDFEVEPGRRALFLFATLDGLITGWNPGADPTHAIINVRQTDAVYTGLAIGNNGSGNFLYAANSADGRIDVYSGTFAPASLGGSFTDPTLPAGFTPYNIQNLGGTLFVTYENEAGGGGIVNAFDLNGNLLRRISANGDGGPLDSPWGLALAPASFGPFGSALLVGNEEDGRISAFDPLNGQFLGQLRDARGHAIANPGLWGLIFGNGGSGGDPNFLYFAAGIEGQHQGLFGSIRVVDVTGVPEPSTASLLGLGALAVMSTLRRRRVPTVARADDGRSRNSPFRVDLAGGPATASLLASGRR